MKVNSVKQFVKSNISQFEKSKGNCHTNRCFYLYDKNNVYRGEYGYIRFPAKNIHGVITSDSMSMTKIMNDKLKQALQEIVYIEKKYTKFYNPLSDDRLKTEKFPTEITTTTTIMDFINDKFTTFRTVSKLKNKLQRMQKENPDFIYSDNFVIYEPLKEKPQYEKTVEVIKEGSISETDKDNRGKKGHSNQIPYMYW